MKKYVIYILILMMTAVMFTGCAEESTKTAADAVKADVVNEGDSVIATAPSADDDLGAVAADYAENDLMDTYDAADAVAVVLSDDGSQIDGEGVEEKSGKVTITSDGVYVLSGILSDGQLVIDAEKEDVIRLIFDGVSITNSGGCAVYIKQAEKVIITLAKDSENVIADAAEYAKTGDDDPDAAIFASDDLSINGSGTLTVTGNYKHAIKTVDDLVITGGTLSITAVEEGLRGKDSVAIKDGNITINAEDNAIESDNDSDDDKGWVVVDGGTMIITADGNGIDGSIGVVINGGDIGITAEQDALHSNGSVRVTGGTMEISAGDDGAHADNAVDITGGTIDILQSYEGLEGAEVTISGGIIKINARDDGLNAAGGSDADMVPGDNFRQTGSYFISVSGGDVYVKAGGDGVDSNGDIAVSGGTLIVDGPEDNRNAAMDIERGTFVVKRRNAGGGRIDWNAGSSDERGTAGTDHHL